MILDKNQEKAPGFRQQIKPPLWTLNFIILCLSSVAVHSTFNMLNITLPIYIETFGGTGIAGLHLATLTIGAVIIRPVAGWALDTYGRPLVYLSGLLPG